MLSRIANPPPKTTNNPEWKKATEELLIRQNANPIAGVSARARAAAAKAESGEDDDE